MVRTRSDRRRDGPAGTSRRRVGTVFTDLDGTLLERDGRLGAPAERALDRLRALSVPVVLLTSKTRQELQGWLARTDAGGMGSFENGAGIVGPAGVEVSPAALSAVELERVLREIAGETAVPLRAIGDLSDAELGSLTGLRGGALAAARGRAFDLPFLAPAGSGALLGRGVASRPGLRLTRGGTFWHLSGPHDKRDACLRLREVYALPGPVVALGDAANDAGFLALSDVAILVPRDGAVDPELAALAPPGALRAPAAAGAGWAAALERLLED